MLIYDSNKKVSNPPETAAMEAYLKGVFDAAEFKEEDHPRGGKGSESGGKFVKSEKTKRKEDEVDDLGDPSQKEGTSTTGKSFDDVKGRIQSKLKQVKSIFSNLSEDKKRKIQDDIEEREDMVKDVMAHGDKVEHFEDAEFEMDDVLNAIKRLAQGEEI